MWLAGSNTTGAVAEAYQSKVTVITFVTLAVGSDNQKMGSSSK